MVKVALNHERDLMLRSMAQEIILALERLAFFDIIHLEWDRSPNAAPPYLRARTHQNRRTFSATLQEARL